MSEPGSATPVETFLFVPEVVAVPPTARPVEGPALSLSLVPVISHLGPPAVPGLRPQETQPGLDLPSRPGSHQTAPLTVSQTEVVVSIPATATVVKPATVINISYDVDINISLPPLTPGSL